MHNKYKLRDLLTIKNGEDYRKFSKGYFPVYGSGGIMTYIDKYIYDGKSILLPRKGSLNNIMFVNGKFWTVDTIYWSIINENIVDAYYLYNYLKILKFDNIHTGSTLPSMTSSAYYDIPITLPNMLIQKKISKVLHIIDEKIELNNKINSELEKIAKELYDYWFIQFEFPDKNNRPYKSNNGKMVYNEILKKEIPYGWKVQNLFSNDLTKIIEPGIDIFREEKTYLPTSSINNDNIIDFSNEITFDNRESRANMQPIKNSVWFAKMKNSKKILYFGEYSNFYLEKLIISTGMCGLCCKEIFSLEYIWNFINSDIFEIRKDIIAHGATQQAVNNEDLAFIPLLVPSREILNLYHLKTKELYYKKYINEIENYSLVQLRDFLLPMLMNGQISVKN